MKQSIILSAMRDIVEDECWLGINGMEFHNGDIRLSASLKNRDVVVANYQIEFGSVLDFTIAELGGGWNYLGNDHYRILAITENAADLYIGDKTDGLKTAMVDIMREHLLVWNDWIPISEIINSSMISPAANWSIGGKLASGPMFVIKKYAEILTRYNVPSTIIPLPGNYKGNESTIDSIAGVHFGNSYIISRFVTEKLV